ncbi:MAG: hypothetical protein Q8O24_09450, partial [Gallionellaceae bacterium]|nr:hypothetical protein [Gallionellaceae bacterium]
CCSYRKMRRIASLLNISCGALLSTASTLKTHFKLDYAAPIPRSGLVRVRQAAENERLKIEEAKRLALESDLKSGRKQPENFSELKIATGAVDGMAFASAPKIKPDNKLYAMVGVIDSAGNKPEFMASNGVEGLRMLGYRNTEHTYFRVKIPKSMQSRYYDTAKIGVWFRLIGRYVANGSYSTVAGQKKSMPVFEATYWEPADVIGDAIKAQLQEVFERAK